MKLENPQITILVNSDETTIEIHDSKSATTFVSIRLTPEQLSTALSRLASTACEASVDNLDRVGKKHEWKHFEFEISKLAANDSTHGSLNQICLRALKEAGMEDWVSDNYYKSQSSFFMKSGKHFARTTVRRWV